MAQVLDGITVLDFTWGLAGGIATMVLFDFGAEVIKIEPPGGDPFRGRPASLQWNRGKKSVILDLKTPQGQERVRGLVRSADVVVESFRPRVAERLGIGYDDPRFKTAPFLMEADWDTLREMILDRVSERTLDEWMDLFVNETADVAAEPFLTSQEGMDHPQIVHNGDILYVQDPGSAGCASWVRWRT